MGLCPNLFPLYNSHNCTKKYWPNGASHIFWGMKDWAKWEISEMVVFSVGQEPPWFLAKPSAVFV